MSLIAIIISFFLGYLYRKNIAEEKIGNAETLSNQILDEANRNADSYKREAILEAKEEVHKLRSEQDEEAKERNSELQKKEDRVAKRELILEKRSVGLDDRESNLNVKINEVYNKEKQIDELIEEQKDLVAEKQLELSRVAELTRDEAQEIILNEVKDKSAHEAALIIREAESKANDEAESIAREIIGTAIQRYAADHVAETTVSIVNLPNDDMKGRIIGREGRNIRAFESLTGIDLIIDDTPEAVVLSGFDPIRREIARISLEKLIIDGRIHPTRIEEMIEKSKEEVQAEIKRAGEDALDEVGIYNINKELVNLLGRLKYRTSYGQNVLRHSIEVATIASMIAEDLGADAKIARRGGLLHDIGKAVTHELEGPHVELGVRMARKYKEHEEVIHCIESHHGDVEPKTIEAVIVQAADAISAARPGARRESVENYIKRLENLEQIANSFEGIENSYAIQAGREIRVMVKPDQINEDQMTIKAKQIAEKIESELEYPGQIKINVIRETRSIDYAK